MTIGYGIIASLAFSAAFLMAIATMPGARAQTSTSGAEVVTNGPQINPGDRSSSWSAQQNVRDSERYEAVVRTNSSFPANRISKECGRSMIRSCMPIASQVLTSKGLGHVEPRLPALLPSRSQL